LRVDDFVFSSQVSYQPGREDAKKFMGLGSIDREALRIKQTLKLSNQLNDISMILTKRATVDHFHSPSENVCVTYRPGDYHCG
jgi:hypothetical protein